jgi:hypothetical protein
VGFSNGENFFYILDLDLGVYDNATGIQNYNYVHLNLYNKLDLSLNQTIDLTVLLSQFMFDNSIIIGVYAETGPLVYFQNRVIFRAANSTNYYNIEYNLTSNSLRIVGDLPFDSGYLGFNFNDSFLWTYNPVSKEIIELSFNEVTELFTEIQSMTFNGMGSDTIVYYIDNSIFTFRAGYTPIESSGNVPDSYQKFDSLSSRYPIYESEIIELHCLPQIIPDGDYIWAVSDDGAGTVEIVKLDPTGTLVSGCEGTQTAMTLPQTIQIYVQNFGPLFLALGWIGVRRRK